MPPLRLGRKRQTARRLSVQQFIVYLDRKLATSKVKAAVLAAFALPRRGTKFEVDPHYTTDRAALELMFGGD
jgi:hypothetical protein